MSEGPMIDLDEWDKLMIVLGSVLFLLLVLIILVCVLHPLCYLHKICPCKYEDDEKALLQPAYGSLYDPGMSPGRKGHFVKGKHGTVWQPMVPLKESELSDWSDISVPEMIELKQDGVGRQRRTSRTSDYSSSASTAVSPVQHESRLAYGVAHDRAKGVLCVRVIQLGNFRVTEPDGATMPYVKVRLYRSPKHFFTFKLSSANKDFPMNNLESEVQTKILRRTDNPLFNESFKFPVDGHDITEYAVRFLVCDVDKFLRHIIIGETVRDLSKIDLIHGEEILFNDLLMTPQEENLGELHVALMYLPTAEKLSVILLSAKNLRPIEGAKRNIEIFAKITLMHDGRPLKKTKTSGKASDLSPVFNETFVFDVPVYQLDKVYFSFAIIGVDKDKEDGRRLLGRLYLGVNFEATARAQWLEMVNNARKQVGCWHRLQS
ncbi:synaptotagmin-1-like [Biomphalaria glabrata]|uniref:Synaptotagmin-1-like n=1 Tax=Biomphalaria glabrata TaxID=6526 RepID=A0A9W2YNB2_BIOGL|nr:synaptotagmin-1-like [Biomphalaria glabrata]XP_055864138.1 synaptotagmin-1-like [Biomphalaria glabrata]XP_055864139.1 synaptotagmin-1-like [Biomphalaria glabrata]XP_055864140.1 synaptotagmin-1-like [Biomphalaria glabrata]KAI8795863.1 synaptotagmin-1 [Biomphalaria glabrata]